MPDDATAIPARPSAGRRHISAATMEQAAELALQQRRARGEIMTYELDGWIVREYPGQRVERLAPLEQFRSEDFPVVP